MSIQYKPRFVLSFLLLTIYSTLHFVADAQAEIARIEIDAEEEFADARPSNTLLAVLTEYQKRNADTEHGLKLVYALKANARVFSVIPVRGRISYDAEIWPETYSIRSDFQLTGLARLFVKYRLEQVTTGFTKTDGFHPFSYVSQSFNNRENLRLETTYSENTVDVVRLPRYAATVIPKTTAEQKRDSTDPLTAVLNMISLGYTDPLRVFDGEYISHLESRSTNTATGTISTKLGRLDADFFDIDISLITEENTPKTNTFVSAVGLSLARLENGLSVPVRFEILTDRVGKITFNAQDFTIAPISPPE